jgi:hypothetical protein
MMLKWIRIKEGSKEKRSRLRFEWKTRRNRASWRMKTKHRTITIEMSERRKNTGKEARFSFLLTCF